MVMSGEGFGGLGSGVGDWLDNTRGVFGRFCGVASGPVRGAEKVGCGWAIRAVFFRRFCGLILSGKRG